MKRRRPFLGLHILTMAMTLLVATLDDQQAVQAAGVKGDWPRINELVTKPAQGQWAKYHLRRTMNGQTQEYYQWQILDKVENGRLHVRIILAAKELTPQPPREDAPGVQVRTEVLELQEPLSTMTIPPVAQVTKDESTSQTYTHLLVGGTRYSGTEYTRQIQMKLPGNMAMTCDVSLWANPDVPVTGIVRQLARIHGPRAMSMEAELVTSSVAQAKAQEAAEADAKAYAVPAINNPRDILEYSEKLAFSAWKLDSLGHAAQQQAVSSVEAFHGQFAIAAMEMNLRPWALKARQRITNYRYNHYVTQAFERVYSLHGTRDDMLKFGTSPTRVDAIRLQHIVDDKAPYAQYEFDEYLNLASSQDDPALRRMVVTAGLNNKALTPGQHRQLVLLFMEKNDHQTWFHFACLKAAREDDLETLEKLPALSPNAKTDPWHAIAMAQLYLKRDDASLLKPALDEAIAATNRAMAPSSDLSLLNRESAHNDLMNLLKEARDPRYLAVEKEVYAARLETIQSRIAKDPALARDKYTAPNLAKAAAINGDWDKAVAIITAMKEYEPSQMIPVLVLYYAHSKDKQPANDAWSQLKGDATLLSKGQTFRTYDLKAEAALGFAEYYRALGDQGGNEKWLGIPNYDNWLDIALDQSVIAHVRMVDYNKAQTDSKNRAFWRTGSEMMGTAPYQSVMQHLLKYPSPENDERLLKLLMQLKSEMPATDNAGKAWKDAIVAMAKAGRRDQVVTLLKYLPGDWMRRWYTDIFTQATQHVAAIEPDSRGNVAYVRKLVAMREKVMWKMKILRVAIIALANNDCILDAQSLMEDMKKLVAEEEGWPKDQSFATIAIARALAKRTLFDQALTAFNDRSTNLDESMSGSGFNGRNWPRYLYDMGREIGSKAASSDPKDQKQYEIITTWSNAIKDKRELAAIMAGMARSYHESQHAR